ncbi:MAG: hypothetical protein ABFD64_12870 [Armatimonadota bacterium]
MTNEVLFLDQPSVGKAVTFMQNGQRLISSPVIRVEFLTERPGYACIVTATGSTYVGRCPEKTTVLNTGTTAMPGYPSQPQPPMYPPSQQYQQQYSPVLQTQGNSFSIAAIILGIIALVFCPLLIGTVGIILAAVATSHGERLGKTALAISIAGTIIGTIVGAIIGAFLFRS